MASHRSVLLDKKKISGACLALTISVTSWPAAYCQVATLTGGGASAASANNSSPASAAGANKPGGAAAPQTALQLYEQGWAAYQAGNIARAIELQNASLKLAEEANDIRQIFCCLDDLDSCYLGDPEKRAANFSRMVALTEKTPSLTGWMCRTYIRKAEGCYLRDDVANAENYLLKGRRLAYVMPTVANKQYDVETMHTAIDVLCHMGKYEQALAECKRSLEECQTHKLHVISFARILRLKGQCLAAQEKYSEADNCYQEALLKLEVANCANNTLYGSILFFRSMLHAQFDDLELARVEFDKADSILDKAPNVGSVDVQFRSICGPELLMRFGRLEEAKRAADRLYDFRRTRFSLDGNLIAETKLLCALVQAARGQKEEALLLADPSIYVLQTKLPVDDDRNGRMQWRMAEIQNMCGRTKVAKEYYEKSAAIMKAKFGASCHLYKDCQAKISALNSGTPYKMAMLTPVQNASRSVDPAVSGTAPKVGAESPATVVTTMSGPAAAAAIASSGGQFNGKIGDKWALLVGISKFQDARLNLKFPSKDASDLYHVLIDKLNFAPDHVALLTNQYATRENILSMLGDKWLPRVAAPEDLVLIFLSTHGSPSDLDVGGINYLLAHNTDPHSLYATGIPLQDLVNMVKKRVHSKRVLIVLDACHSGSAQVESKGMVISRAVDADAVAQGTGQMVICSSSPQELSWESKQYPNGVFTHHFIQTLSQSGGMKPFNSIFQTLSEATRNEVMHDRSVMQNPVLRSAWSGDDLFLGAKATNPRPGLGIKIYQSDLPFGAANSTVQSKKAR